MGMKKITLVFLVALFFSGCTRDGSYCERPKDVPHPIVFTLHEVKLSFFSKYKITREWNGAIETLYNNCPAGAALGSDSRSDEQETRTAPWYPVCRVGHPSSDVNTTQEQWDRFVALIEENRTVEGIRIEFCNEDDSVTGRISFDVYRSDPNCPGNWDRYTGRFYSADAEASVHGD